MTRQGNRHAAMQVITKKGLSFCSNRSEYEAEIKFLF